MYFSVNAEGQTKQRRCDTTLRIESKPEPRENATTLMQMIPQPTTMSHLLPFLAFPAVFADSEILPSKRIFNGFDADPDRYPYMVVLRDYFQQYVCGGTLIAPDIVLSAAHCGESSGIATVLIGRYDGSNEHEANVETLVVDPNASVRHPSYDSYTMENDFYVIKLFGKSMNTLPSKSIALIMCHSLKAALSP